MPLLAQRDDTGMTAADYVAERREERLSELAHVLADRTVARFGSALAAACWLHSETDMVSDEVGHQALLITKSQLTQRDFQTYGEWLDGLNTPQVEAVERVHNQVLRAEVEAAKAAREEAEAEARLKAAA